MKKQHWLDILPDRTKESIIELMELAQTLGQLGKRHPVPIQLFLLMVFNLILTPVVLAQTSNQISTGQAYWIAFLGMITLALSIYLFVVIFQPERF